VRSSKRIPTRLDECNAETVIDITNMRYRDTVLDLIAGTFAAPPASTLLQVAALAQKAFSFLIEIGALVLLADAQ
jgi:hypothetical protein